MSDSLYALQKLDALERRVDELEAQVRLLTDLVSERTNLREPTGTTCDLVLVTYPSNRKIDAIKLLRESTGLGLREAKELSEATPCRFHTGVDAARADAVIRKFAAIDAVVERR